MTIKNINVLLAEDDKNFGEMLKTYLTAKGYNTKLCINGEEALNEFLANPYDCCIFDVMMPVKDGFTLAKEVRKKDKKIPILFLTARSLSDDILKGFQIGADDYITKPFNMEVLLMRMNAILRRAGGGAKTGNAGNTYRLGDYVFDHNRQVLTILGKEQKLTSKESELLKLLCENANDLLDRSIALKEIWHDDSYFNARSMDVYITKLRKYLREDDSIELINVHGTGFKLVGNIENI
ncbi:MAG TPA: response regulator transcription factor [Bacteroidales bacterium]|jgi:DNA-binding response OmpR family regulator|nr:response regulator transcription factor [Bacteroidales bacterium]HNZ41781.1 response regulator transcription factor [Bacteroidales bacterium]HOH84401.1 response regulator transcription factor [Bacteroidales bacterium]HPB24407.1 response regulator transcription factor [Bacteroidales bacterium]HPI29315.1 response regulator transcription factor [Bacteroidales bacterium]